MHARRNIYTDVFIRPHERIQSAVYGKHAVSLIHWTGVVYGMDDKGDSDECTLSN